MIYKGVPKKCGKQENEVASKGRWFKLEIDFRATQEILNHDLIIRCRNSDPQKNAFFDDLVIEKK